MSETRLPGERRTLSIPRAARYFLHGEPGPATREVWFGLHGYAQLADEFLAELAPLAAPDRVLVAPEGLSRFYRRGGRGPIGASWMTRVERVDEIEDYVRFLDAVYGEVLGDLAPEARVHVLGFSQGAATAARWAVLGRARVDRLILWGGDVPPDLELAAHREALARMDPTLVCGRQDALAADGRLEREREKLRAQGIECRVVEFDGGHELDEATLRGLE